MFKFDFGNETSEKAAELNEIEWKRSEEIYVAQIDLTRTEYSVYAVGPCEIKTVSMSAAVQEALQTGSDSIITAEENHSDLVPGKYEGGLKIWECTRDLADLMLTLDVKWEEARVLDLGCGAGLLGCLAHLKGSRVVFQDYNKEVLQLVTGKNILLNKGKDETAEMYSGDWLSFNSLYKRLHPGAKFDVILTSETIYNASNYRKLHDVIYDLLDPCGVCYLAGKSFYFGVGGSIRAFIEFVEKQTRLNIETCWSHTEGVAREILRITHKTDIR